MRTPRTVVLSPAAPLRLAHALAWLLLSLFLSVASAQELVAVPPLQARVTDLTGTLAADRVAALDAQLRAFEQRKGVQIAVLMVRSTRPEPVEQYALRVVEQWKLGRRKVDDGALLLVAKDDRTVRIEVGYGIEGALSDVVSRRIIDEVITPRLRQGD
ncbi:TPM domain-containing protein, partial [Pseudomonas aeruginosa]